MNHCTRRHFIATASAAGAGLIWPTVSGLAAATASAPARNSTLDGTSKITPFSIEENRLVVPAGTYQIGGGREVRVTTTVRLAVAPADVVRVRDEEMHLSPDKPGGFFTGTKLAGTLASSIGAFGSLIEESVSVRDSSGQPLRPGEDFLISAPFALLGLAPQSRVKPTDTVFASYSFYRQRIDLVAVDAQGVPSLVPGTPHIATPSIPAPPAGSTAIATLYRPFRAKALEEAHVFPITSTAREAATATTRGRVPKTLAKLRRGDAVTVVCWGDSITVGADVAACDAWANRLRTELVSRFPKAALTYRNHSIGGSKSAQWLNNGEFGDLPKKDPEKCRFEHVVAGKPDLVVMEFLNDIVFSEAVLERTYTAIHDAFTSRGIEWIIVTPSQKIPSNYNLTEMKVPEIRILDSFLRRFADRHGIALADTSARWAHLHREGIPYFGLFANAYNHPNAFGHGLFVEEILSCLEG